MIKRMSFLLLLLPLPIFANTLSKNFPKDLIYQNHPIDPLCIYEAKDAETLVDLNKCGVEAEHGRKITGHSAKLLKDGFYGYEYKWPGITPIGGYSYYKVIGQMDGKYLILSFNNTGGSGDFSGLSTVERKGHSIRIESLLNGDRCNNGIKSASINGKTLSFSINLTAADYLTIAGQNPHHLKAYDDLAACAACCEGVVNYKVDNLTQLSQPTLVSVDLGSDKIVPDKNSQGTYQFCFDQLLTTYQAKQQVMTPEVLKQFVQAFNQQCVNN